MIAVIGIVILLAGVLFTLVMPGWSSSFGFISEALAVVGVLVIWGNANWRRLTKDP